MSRTPDRDQISWPFIVAEDSPYLDGPQIDELSASARDALAEVDDSRLFEVARRWTMEPLCPFRDGDVLDVVEELVALARRAKESDEMLYCWWIPG
ncbi:hypothetical protein EDD27_9802 [Nonomuraea polychroma]|uniref:Uncharacterized protein n=1 Tax=Nonomuraea polychroma TaxID=46176 RepID=A0A438MMK4_9ACTN|nr:hypothetical protein [Nonomuraea polychroma]RVX46889.1 hypothetical protein EDD27_9802 [Nonomuraea polychroma]